MSLQDKLALVQAIWDNIAASAERPPISEALRAELDRRIAEHEANPDDVIPWDEVKADILARLSKKP